MWQFITGWSSGQNARTFSMVLVNLWTHDAGSTVQQHTHQSLLYRQMGWSCVSFFRKMCNNYIHGFFFFFFFIMQFARFIEFVGVIKAEALSKHTFHVKVWWFHNYQKKIGPLSKRMFSTNFPAILVFWSPPTSLIINYCTPVRFSFFFFSFFFFQ